MVFSTFFAKMFFSTFFGQNDFSFFLWELIITCCSKLFFFTLSTLGINDFKRCLEEGETRGEWIAKYFREQRFCNYNLPLTKFRTFSFWQIHKRKGSSFKRYKSGDIKEQTLNDLLLFAQNQRELF
jgi:hypothetical protein